VFFVDNLFSADFIASSEPLVSDFKIIFNCFRLHSFILDINKSIFETLDHFLLSNNSLNFDAFSLAIFGELTACNISHHFTTLFNQTTKTGSHGIADFIHSHLKFFKILTFQKDS
jgi:hypothetical protein